MTGLSVRHSGAHCSVGVELGGLRGIQTHLGLDHRDYVTVTCEHGRLETDADTWADVVRASQEAHVGDRQEKRA